MSYRENGDPYLDEMKSQSVVAPSYQGARGKVKRGFDRNRNCSNAFHSRLALNSLNFYPSFILQIPPHYVSKLEGSEEADYSGKRDGREWRAIPSQRKMFEARITELMGERTTRGGEKIYDEGKGVESLDRSNRSIDRYRSKRKECEEANRMRNILFYSEYKACACGLV